MTTIPQRELRNDISSVLRRAEAGERFTVTVDGRPVAELGPVGGDAPLTAERFNEILAATPVDSGWAEELAAMRREEIEAAEEKERQ